MADEVGRSVANPALDIKGLDVAYGGIPALTGLDLRLDRGILAPGMRADVNLIDFQNLNTHSPAIINDLPAGSARLNQAAQGYLATIVAGEVTYQNGNATDALPGRLVRGAQTAPR